jgi:signal transduction histidine kinase
MRGDPAVGLLVSALGVAAVTGVVALAKSEVPVFSLGILYVFAVLPIAFFWGLALALAVAVASVVTFDYLSVPPVHSFHLWNVADCSALAVYLVTAVVVSVLATTARRRAELSEEARAVLAGERAALRRVAVLVARQRSSEEIFAAVAREVGMLLHADNTSLLRYEADRTATLVASWPERGRRGRDGQQRTSEDRAVVEVSSPIVVAGGRWGVVIASSGQPLAPDSEMRIASFTELVATAIANAQSRAELTASRARMVAAADDSRRRLERDLHDGTQQRLVSLGLELRMAQALIPQEAREAHAQLDFVERGLMSALDDLREISQGIHPAILSRGGLGPALRALARRATVPVDVYTGPLGKLPEGVEIAAYYVVSEALTNAAKHADASEARVKVELIGERLHVRVTDDGVGGADPGQGSGLTGLSDRVGALGGLMMVRSPPGAGTAILAELPLTATWQAPPTHAG